MAGAPLYAVPRDEEIGKYAKMVSEEIEKIRIATDVNGVVVKTDTLGSLEAIAVILQQNNIPIRLADVGDVSKRDVVEAAVVKENDPLYGAILAFGVKILPDAEEEAATRGIQIFRERIIYHVIDNYLAWFKKQHEMEAEQKLEAIIRPAKIRVMEGFVFRRARPAIFGVEILAGRIAPKVTLIRAENGEEVGEIQQIQEEGKALPEALQGMQVAVSMDKPTVGRHIFEKDLLYVKVPEPHAKALLTTFVDRLTAEEQETLSEYLEIMKKKMPFWGA